MSSHLAPEQFQLLLEGDPAGQELHLRDCAQCQLELSRQAAAELQLILLGMCNEQADLLDEVATSQCRSEEQTGEVAPPATWSAMGGYLLAVSCVLGLICWGVGNELGGRTAIWGGGSCHQLHAWCR